MKTLKFFPLLILLVFNMGCDEEGCMDPAATNYNPEATVSDNSCVYPEIRGCTDEDALNFDSTAEIDDGSCQYSMGVFYRRFDFFNGIPILSIDVYVNGNLIGSLNTTYPNGPGNCTAIGTISYQFLNGNSVDWNTVVFLSNGQQIFNSGTAAPNRFENCVLVNVT